MARTWFITGAGRGLGLEVARAAFASGDNVVAAVRRPENVSGALLDLKDDVLIVPLDVTNKDSIVAAVGSATERFGRIDVLVNNAGYGQLGAFEELSEAAVARQFDTNVFGAFAVTRAILPLMRAQRSGHIITISSLTGIIGIDGSSIYCAAKFAVTGWSESLSLELRDFGIDVTSVHPGMFRTDFLDASSMSDGDIEIDDYRDTGTARRDYLEASNHAQRGNPAAFGPAIVALANADVKPARFASGSDAIQAFEQRAKELTDSVVEWEALSHSTDFE